MRQEILDKITGNSNPFKINLTGLEIKDDEIAEIMTYIKEHQPTATKIDLDNNLIGDDGAKTLTTHLQKFDNLKEVSIQFNQIGKPGALFIFQLKNNFSSLDILFRGNKITDVVEMHEIEQSTRSPSYKP